MLNDVPYDILSNMLQNHMSLREMVPLTMVSQHLRHNVKVIMREVSQRKLAENPQPTFTLSHVPKFSTIYDSVLQGAQTESAEKKAALLLSYPGTPNFFSCETGAESLAAYDPCTLMNTPYTQFIRMRIDSIICNVAVSRKCQGVQLVVDTLRIFHYTKDILDLYPTHPCASTSTSTNTDPELIHLGAVFKEFPIKASTIYILFEFENTLTREECFQHIRLDMMHPPYPFLNQYHMIDIPLEIIRHAFTRSGCIFDTDFGHITGIIFHCKNPAALGSTTETSQSCIYMIEDNEVDPQQLPLLHDSLPNVRVLRFSEARVPPILINVYPATTKTAIFFITTNILSLLMNWQLQCA